MRRTDPSRSPLAPGIGIQTDKLEVIFEEFAQARRKQHARLRGTGIGLTIARASRGGGREIPRERIGSGSTFTLTLPLRSASPGA